MDLRIYIFQIPTGVLTQFIVKMIIMINLNNLHFRNMFIKVIGYFQEIRILECSLTFLLKLGFNKTKLFSIIAHK